jgi:hypothetical protein
LSSLLGKKLDSLVLQVFKIPGFRRGFLELIHLMNGFRTLLSTSPLTQYCSVKSRGEAFGRQLILEFRLSRSKSAIAQRLANVHTRTAMVAGDQV